MNTWLWIPIVVFSAALQTVRNASQKSLTRSAGTLAATFVRFVYGLPFTALGLGIVLLASKDAVLATNGAFVAWVFAGAFTQLAGTALLLASMEQRSFIVAIAYSKTEVLQIALFSVVLLGEWVTRATALAMLLATAGVIMMSLRPGALRLGSLRDWLSSAALLGMGSGAGFALGSVSFRAATLELGGVSPWLAGIYTLFWAQIIQSAALGAYLLARDRGGLVQVVLSWRVSLLAGLTGAVSSMGWFTAFAMRNAADVRTLGLVEMLFGYAVSRLFFKERMTAGETTGMVLLAIGLVILCLQL